MSEPRLCWRCKGPITGPWRTLFPKLTRQETASLSYEERWRMRRMHRTGVIVCVHCYSCYDSNGREKPDLGLLSDVGKPPVPRLGIDLLPGGGTGDK